MNRTDLEGFVFRAADEWVVLVCVMGEFDTAKGRQSMRRRGYDILAIAKMFGPEFTSRIRTIFAGVPTWAVPVETRKKDFKPRQEKLQLDMPVKERHREFAVKILTALGVKLETNPPWQHNLKGQLTRPVTRRRIALLLSMMGISMTFSNKHRAWYRPA